MQVSIPLSGGTITAYSNLCERTQTESVENMLEHAAEKGTHAVIGVRYDANDVVAGVTEVFAYGTVVTVEKM